MLRLKYVFLLAAAVFFLQPFNIALASDQGLIQFFANSSSNTFSNNIRNVIGKRALALKLRLDVYDANRSQQEQINQFRKYARPDVTAIVDLVDAGQCQELLDLAKEVKANVVFINEPPKPSAIEENERLWYVGNDNDIVAYKQGQMIVEYLKNNPQFDLNSNQILDIVLLRGGAENQASLRRTETLKSQLQGAQIKYRFIHDLDCEWSFEQAFNQISRLMSTEAQPIDLIIAHNDDMVLGAVNALQELNEFNDDYVLPPAFGVGGTLESINAMAIGEIRGTIRLDYLRIADLAVAISIGKRDYRTLSSLAGTAVNSHFITVPCNIILSSKENLADVY
ncbi:MAG: substrate-binding domain-containing protein [Succinivibrio sp.]|nr:substrate-binding domain-containing protein [Succinivibrio sp.]